MDVVDVVRGVGGIEVKAEVVEDADRARPQNDGEAEGLEEAVGLGVVDEHTEGQDF